MIENKYLQRWFFIIFALFCIGINIIAFVLYQKNQKINDSKRWVTHTYQVITEEYKLFSSIQDMQTTQRTFLITGSETFLGPYKKAKASAFQSLDTLGFLISDNPVQVQEVERHKQVINQLLDLAEKQISDKAAHSVPVENFDFSINKSLADAIRARHEVIIGNERKLLEIRSRDAEERQKNYIVTLFATAALSALGLLIANGVVAFLIYRRKSAEDDLRRINKEMESFTYIASHDLRSPLVNLKGFATEMKYSIDELKPLIERSAGALSDSEREKAIEVIDKDIPDALRFIHSSVEKMDKLTNAILELSRIGRRTIDFQPVETDKIVRHILETLHHSITSKSIDVKLLPLPNVVADSLSLEQVFGNIIDNAIKYMDPDKKGRIEIGGIKIYRETKFWVKDNGRGIDSHDYQKIFEIYRRAGNTESIPGEGMGMAYVRSTLRRLGGQIWCESTQGLGTTFYFTISNFLKKEPN